MTPAGLPEGSSLSGGEGEVDAEAVAQKGEGKEAGRYVRDEREEGGKPSQPPIRRFRLILSNPQPTHGQFLQRLTALSCFCELLG